MKPKLKKHTRREIVELLESDDELPDSYDETPDIPAYLKDDRFAKPQPMKDLHEMPPENILHTKSLPNPIKDEIVNIPSLDQSCPDEKLKALSLKDNTEQTNNIILISKGVLTKRNIFLIKSIEEYANETTLLWFINFLNNKTVRPHQRSCLVAEVMDDYTRDVETNSDLGKRYYLKVVVN